MYRTNILPFHKTIGQFYFLALICINTLFGNPHNASNTHMDNIGHFEPMIGLIKTGEALDGTGATGGCDFIEYTFTVTNLSNSGEILENVLVTDPLLGGLVPGPNPGDDIGNDGEMAPGEVWTYTATYIITPTDISNGQVANHANVTADVQGQPGVTVNDLSDDDSFLQDEPTVVSLSHCQPNISIIKTGAAHSAVGGGMGCDFIRYQFRVFNEGPQILENVELTDPLLVNPVPGPDSGDTNNDGFLDPDEIWIYVAQYDITQTDIDNGQVVNQATVTADVQGQPGESVSDLSDDDSTLEDDPTVVSLAHCLPGISLIKAGTALSATGGAGCDLILYEFNVANEGALDVLENVVLTDPLLGGEIPGPDSGDANNDGFLDPGEVWIYMAQYEIAQADIDNGQVVNQAEVTADVQGQPGESVSDLSDDDSPLEDDSTVIDLSSCQDASIGLIKEGALVDTDGDGCLDSILYTFTVTNTGTVDLEEITLEDELFNGEVPGPVDGTDNGNDGILSAGESWTYQALYGITQDDIDLGVVVNQAMVNGYPLGSDVPVSDLSDDDNLDEDDPTRTAVTDEICPNDPADMGLVKEGTLIDADGDGCLDSILYTFTVTNTGTMDIGEVTLEDDLFDGEIPGPLVGTDDGNDGILSVGESWTYQALYGITQDDIDLGVVVNQAIVNGNTIGFNLPVFDLSDDDNLDEDDPTRTPVTDEICPNDPADMGLIKEGILVDIDQDGCLDSVLYTFTVTNTGTVDIGQVTLEDDLFNGGIPGPLAGTDDGNDDILSVGESWTYQALYGITPTDIDQGYVANQALVYGTLVGLNIPVLDQSDDDSLDEDEITITAIPDNACSNGGGGTGLGLGLIKESQLIDLNGDNCMESIRYTFTVTNAGNVPLQEIYLEDGLLDGQLTNLVGGTDENNDGILSIGESWEYQEIYHLTQEDVDNGSVINMATVTAKPINLDVVLFDHSDNDNLLENDPTVTVVPNNACTDGEGINTFEIFNGITPNGDGMNDYFRIEGIENYPDNNVKIFNRWGVLVYESDNYGQGSNLFYGISEGRATFQQDRELPSGTYFYILTFIGENPGENSYSGYLYINRD